MPVTSRRGPAVTTLTAASKRSATVSIAPAADLRTLLEVYGSRAQALAYRITRDRELAADAVQEALLAAWRTRDSYDPARGTISSWFLTIVHRRAVDQVRRATSRGHATRLDEETERLPTQATSPEEQAVRTDRARRIRAEVNRLPLARRQVLELAYYAGYTQTQIARVLDLPLGTVKTRTATAIRQLRATVEHE